MNKSVKNKFRIAVIAFSLVLVYIISSFFDFHDNLCKYVQAYEYYELDEFIIVGLYMMVFLFVKNAYNLKQIKNELSIRQQYELQLKATIDEKKLLLKELHHRVKNNLSLIISLINMMQTEISDNNTKNLFKEIIGRIQSFSIIHDHLNKNDFFNVINLRQLIKNIGENIQNGYTRKKNITIIYEIDEITLSTNQAIPCGLIINEVLTNSVKYAFPDSFRDCPEICIKAKQKNRHITFSVSDNGIGIPKLFEKQNNTTLGLELITLLIKKQLGGDLTIDSDNGTRIVFSFPLA